MPSHCHYCTPVEKNVFQKFLWNRSPRKLDERKVCKWNCLVWGLLPKVKCDRQLSCRISHALCIRRVFPLIEKMPNLSGEKSVGIRVDSREGQFLPRLFSKTNKNWVPFWKKWNLHKQGGRPPAGVLSPKAITLSWTVKDLRNSWRFVTKMSPCSKKMLS